MNIKFYFLKLAALAILLNLFSCSNVLNLKPPVLASKGYLDLSKIDFQSKEIINLDGEWEFYWSQFIKTDPFINLDTLLDTSKSYIKVPGTWNGEKSNHKSIDGTGFASYRLIVKLKPNVGLLQIKSLDVATSYKFWINGKLILKNGEIGTNSEISKPQYLPLLAVLDNLKEENEFIMEISNFKHSKGGFWESLRIGQIDQIQKYRETKLGFDLFLTGSLLIMGIYHLGLFSLRRNDQSSLLLGAFCFILVLRLLLTGERLFFESFPNFNWEIGSKIEYLTFYFATPIFSWFIHSLYKDEFHIKGLKPITIISMIFVAIVAFTPANIHTITAIPYQIFTILACTYGAFAMILAGIRKKEGAWIAFFGYSLFFATIVNDILYGNFIINTAYLAPFGLFSFIFSQAFLLSLRFSKAFVSVETLSQDLTQTNNAYSKFVPTEFLKLLEKSSITEVKLGDQIQKNMAILFADIRSFTEISENMSPRENFNFINSYLNFMGPIIRENKGFIDKYIGDGIMALFPTNSNDAIHAAIAMQKSLLDFNRATATTIPNLPHIRIGIGVHTGSLMLGTIGDINRMEGTVISDAVNLASRLEGLTKIYGSSIIVSEQTLEERNKIENIARRFLGKVEIKGKKELISVHEIYEADALDLKEWKDKTKEEFEKGIHLFLNNQLIEARNVFRQLNQQNAKDKAAFYYLQKCSP